MNQIGSIIKVSCKIYEMVSTVKHNKKSCQRIGKRVNALKELVETISKQPSESATPVIEKALNELVLTLNSTHDFMETYSDSYYIYRFLNYKNHHGEFAVLNDRLTESFQILSLSLQTEQREKMEKLFSLANRQMEDKKDRKLDNEELKRDLKKYLEDETAKVQHAVKMLEKPTVTSHDIRIIDPKELTYQNPEKPFQSTKTCEFYKGEFNKFPVAIKRYLKTETSTREVKETFNREVETMRRFESPHILRAFGICIHIKDGGSPVYNIVMEYCEFGSLRNVLDSKELRLTVRSKAQMCLGAAHGIFRLHQTEVKAKVHGCLTSSSFMVAKGLILKLSDFELAQTETSLLKNPKSSEKSYIGYCAPELFTSVTTVYSKECEIYSFGIVLWELLTQKTPWHGLSEKEIKQKVLDNQEKEEIAGDYPQEIKEIINDCRSFQSSQRPSAGAVLDRLRNVVMMLEKKKFSTV